MSGLLLTNDLLQVIAWLLGVIISLVTWIGLRQLRRLDAIDKVLRTEIPRLCVDVADLKARITLIEKQVHK